MTTWFKISEAASLALHTMALMASSPGRRLSNREVAKALRVSSAHLSKVMQRLVKSGLLESVRGPAGGFALTKPAAKTTLREVYEAIEGPLTSQGCLLEHPVCQGGKCLLGGLVQKIDQQVIEYLSGTRLSEFNDFHPLA